MSFVLELTPTAEMALQKIAQAHGVTVAEYVAAMAKNSFYPQHILIPYHAAPFRKAEFSHRPSWRDLLIGSCVFDSGAGTSDLTVFLVDAADFGASPPPQEAEQPELTDADVAAAVGHYRPALDKLAAQIKADAAEIERLKVTTQTRLEDIRTTLVQMREERLAVRAQ